MDRVITFDVQVQFRGKQRDAALDAAVPIFPFYPVNHGLQIVLFLPGLFLLKEG